MTCQNCGHELAPTLKYCPKCGTPASMPYSPPVSQVQTSWDRNAGSAAVMPQKRKSNVGKVLLILGVIFIGLLAGVGFAIYYGYKYAERTLKSSEAYLLAEATLKESPEVKERLGEIKSMGFPIGSFQETPDGAGHATFTIAVEGEKASGRYIVILQRSKKVWRVSRAVLNLSGGETINVVEPLEENTLSNDPESEANGNTNAGNSNNKNLNSNQKPVVSGGVIEGKAISKPAPPYPPIAKTARAQGTVVVQITVDEEGKVISAKATSGHPLLRASAESAARQARFTPTLVAGKPVKVTGTISYNFKLEE